MKLQVEPKPQVSKTIVAVDIDEVLGPFMDAFLVYYNQKRGTSHAFEAGIRYHRLDEMLGGTLEELKQEIQDYFRSEHYQQTLPLEGAIQSIDKLKDAYDLHLVTAREGSISEATEKWIAQHFKDIFLGVHFADWTTDLPAKLAAMQKIEASILIDDSPIHAREAVQAGMQAILFGDYPWNETEDLPEGVQRAKDWAAVERILL